MCGSGGEILAQLQPPRKETLNQRGRMLSAAHCPSQVIVQFEDTEDSDEEIDEYVVISPGEPAPIPLNPEADSSCVKKEINISCMEAMKLPKASKVIKDCIAEESKGNGEIVDGYPTLSIEEQAELEALSKSELFNTQGLNDEEIQAAIMGWW